MSTTFDQLARDREGFEAKARELRDSKCPCCQMRGRLLLEIMPVFSRELDGITTQDACDSFMTMLPHLLAQLVLSSLHLITPAERLSSGEEIIEAMTKDITIVLKEPGGSA